MIVVLSPHASEETAAMTMAMDAVKRSLGSTSSVSHSILSQVI